jgi:hypothetical protein
MTYKLFHDLTPAISETLFGFQCLAHRGARRGMVEVISPRAVTTAAQMFHDSPYLKSFA